MNNPHTHSFRYWHISHKPHQSDLWSLVLLQRMNQIQSKIFSCHLSPLHTCSRCFPQHIRSKFLHFHTDCWIRSYTWSWNNGKIISLTILTQNVFVGWRVDQDVWMDLDGCCWWLYEIVLKDGKGIAVYCKTEGWLANGLANDPG